MKKILSLSAIIAIVIIAYSCNKKKDTLTTTAYLDLPATPYVYVPYSSPDYNSKATLGRVLFYDSHMSLNNAVSCGSCHKQSLAFGDNTALSTGYEGRLTKRNSIAINTLSSAGSLFWDGRESNVTNLIMRPVTNHVEMGIDDPSVLPQKLAALSYYTPLFINAYGDGEVTVDRISECITDFITSIASGQTRLDEYNNGNTTALTAQEVNGMKLFNGKYNCGTCHNGGGGYYGGGSFKDIGLDASYTDMGRGTITGLPEDKGTFRIPNLRNVALTAPYMHDGRYKTLSDVVDHYSHNIENSPNLDVLLTDGSGHAKSMNIPESDKQDIIAFLGTLTDYNMITDPKFSNPFKVK